MCFRLPVDRFEESMFCTITSLFELARATCEWRHNFVTRFEPVSPWWFVVRFVNTAEVLFMPNVWWLQECSMPRARCGFRRMTPAWPAAAPEVKPHVNMSSVLRPSARILSTFQTTAVLTVHVSCPILPFLFEIHPTSLQMGWCLFLVLGGPGVESVPEDRCFFEGDQRMHRLGSVFHPYLVPFGYQKCAVCACTVRFCRIFLTF